MLEILIIIFTVLIVIPYSLFAFSKIGKKKRDRIRREEADEKYRLKKLKDAEAEKIKLEKLNELNIIGEKVYNETLKELEKGLVQIEIPKEDGIKLLSGEKCFSIMDCKIDCEGYSFDKRENEIVLGLTSLYEMKVYITNQRVILKSMDNSIQLLYIIDILSMNHQATNYYIYNKGNPSNSKHYLDNTLIVRTLNNSYYFCVFVGESAMKIAAYLEKIHAITKNEIEITDGIAKIIKCEFCGVENIIDIDKTLICRQCGAPLKLKSYI